MKNRWASVFLLSIPLVVLAADQAPPKELIENLDFFQHMDLIKDNQFLSEAAHDVEDVEVSTGAVEDGGKSHAKDL